MVFHASHVLVWPLAALSLWGVGQGRRPTVPGSLGSIGWQCLWIEDTWCLIPAHLPDASHVSSSSRQIPGFCCVGFPHAFSPLLYQVCPKSHGRDLWGKRRYGNVRTRTVLLLFLFNCWAALSEHSVEQMEDPSLASPGGSRRCAGPGVGSRALLPALL